jgi:tetratricopeptide (TPR) repeat protein
VRPQRAVLVAVVLAAFWAVVWLQSADSALTRVPVLDEAWYLREAARIRDDGIVGRPFVMSPLYPIAAAVLGAGRTLPGGVLEGGHPRALLAMQAAAWMAIGALIFTTVRERGGAGRAGAVIAFGAALLFWLYRPGAVYARTILLEIPLALTVTAYLALLSCWRVRTTRRPFVVLLVAGLCLGLATLLRAHVLALLVPGAVVVAVRTRRWRVAAVPIAVLMGGALLPVVLAAAHNTAACSRPAGPVLNGGINLYLGNVASSRGLFVTPVGLDLEREPAGQSYLAGRFHRDDLGVCEADRLWFAEALREIRAHPGRAAGGWLRKVWLHAQGWEISQVTPLGAWAREVPVLRALWVPYGMLTVLGLAGLAAALGRGRSADDVAVAVLWGGSLVLLVALQSLVFVVSRYRLVLVPPLCVLAGLGALRLWPLLVARRWRAARLPAAVALVAVIAGVPWGLSETRRLWAALETQNEALRWERWAAAQPDASGRAWPRAQRLYRDLIAAQPERGEAYLGLARVLFAAGEVSAASEVLAGGLVRADQTEPLQRELVSLLLQQQRLSEARVQLEAFLREHPQDADMLHNLTVLLGKTGRWEQAHDVARRMRAAAPDDARSYLDLAAIQVVLGRRDDAVAILAEGLSRLPGHPELAATLERVRARP